MKTPYDTALRIAERRLDAVRTEMAKAAAQLRLIELEEDAASTAFSRETQIAGDDARMTTERYFVRARDHRAQLVALRAATNAELESLRQKAVAVYGERIALDTAIARHREEAERAAAAAEQSAMDDLTGGRYRHPRRRPAPKPAPGTAMDIIPLIAPNPGGAHVDGWKVAAGSHRHPGSVPGPTVQ